jgi:hypothetical protein
LVSVVYVSRHQKSIFNIKKTHEPRYRPMRPRSELTAELRGAVVQHEWHLRGGPPPTATTMCCWTARPRAASTGRRWRQCRCPAGGWPSCRASYWAAPPSRLAEASTPTTACLRSATVTSPSMRTEADGGGDRIEAQMEAATWTEADGGGNSANGGRWRQRTGWRR